MQKAAYIIISIFIIPALWSQVAPPDPCTDGTQQSCRCESSPVLCTVDDLDGFEFSMSDFLHPEDGPESLCDENAAPHNPTWFSFVAWCEDLELNVEIENCSNVCRTGGPCNFFCALAGNCTSGVQIGVFGDCEFNEVVACNVNDCGNEGDKRLTMTDLTIGNTYHFVIDGCSGSACDLVRINVVGTCGSPTIQNWSMPIEGPDSICVNDTAIYQAEILDGADLYTWYLDGTEVQVSEQPNYSLQGLEPGEYQLCIDASNDRCIPVTSEPSQLCRTITVVQPEIQNFSVPNISCPNDSVWISWDRLSANDFFASALVVTNLEGIVVDRTNRDSLSFSHSSCDSFIAYAYLYTPEEWDLPNIGAPFTVPDCSNECCAVDSAIFEFRDQTPPQFLDVPADIELPCLNAIPPLPDLSYEDNCGATGFIAGSELGRQELIDTGSFRRVWRVTDQCDNSAAYEQVIRIPELNPIGLMIQPDSAQLISGGFITVEATTNIDEGAIASIQWDPAFGLDCPDCLVTGVTADEDQSYTLTVVDTFGCMGSAEFKLLIRNPDVELYIPNVFSPNGDGINDGFTLFSNVNFQQVELMIFDRWGSLLFESRNIVPNSPQSGWDGRYRGKDANTGVYLYSFKIRYSDGTEEILKGQVTMVR